MENAQKRVIALGFFDGVHVGHQALLRRTVERSREQQMEPAVFTFDQVPKAFITGKPVPMLTTPEERARIIEELFGIKTVLVAPFNREMMTTDWLDFLQMMVTRYNAGWLVAGHDYTFGYKNLGNADRLAEQCAKMGIGCDIIPAVTVDGQLVSSTMIRDMLARGETEKARRLLGHGLLE